MREVVANDKWAKARAVKGEVVGGGFFVFRRGDRFNRVGLGKGDRKFYYPFEYPTFEAAHKEAARLASLNPGETYCVFEQKALYKIEGGKQASAA